MRYFVNVAIEINGRHWKDKQLEYPTLERARADFEMMKQPGIPGHSQVYWLGLYSQETAPWMGAVKIDSWCRRKGFSSPNG